jgi:hypothetical protein
LFRYFLSDWFFLFKVKQVISGEAGNIVGEYYMAAGTGLVGYVILRRPTISLISWRRILADEESYVFFRTARLFVFYG